MLFRSTVDINNDIVALEEQEVEEIRRILLALTDAFRARPDDLARTMEVATELDVVQARGRLSEIVGGVEPELSIDGSFVLKAARHPLLMGRVQARLREAGGVAGESGSLPVPPASPAPSPPANQSPSMFCWFPRLGFSSLPARTPAARPSP